MAEPTGRIRPDAAANPAAADTVTLGPAIRTSILAGCSNKRREIEEYTPICWFEGDSIVFRQLKFVPRCLFFWAWKYFKWSNGGR